MAIIVGENSYITLEEAKTYINSDVFNALTDEQQTSYLLNARCNIDTMKLKGTKLDKSTQVLEFPRNWETVVSENVKMAQAFEAFELLTKKDIDTRVVSRSIQGASVTYNKDYVSTYSKYGIYSDKASRLLSKYIARAGGIA